MHRMSRRSLLGAALLLSVGVPSAALAGGETATRPSVARTAVAGTAVARTAAASVPASRSAASVPASRPAADRSAQGSYSDAGGSTDHGGQASVFQYGSWVPVRANEDRVAVTAADSSGLAVALLVETAAPSASRVVCNASGWLAVKPGSRVRVTVLAGTCADGTVSAPTSGSLAFGFHQIPPQSLVATPDRRWAVVIGIQRYGGRTHPTIGGDGDAQAVRTSLLRSGWMPSHILELRDGQATGSAVVGAMDWLVRHSTSATFSVFHYSGHICVHTRGPCASGHTHLWTTDNRFIPDTTVWAHLGRLRGHAWIDIAGCEGGAFGSRLASPLRLYTGSSQPTKTSYEEPDWRESVWTGLTWDQAYLQGAAGPSPLRATIGQMVAYGVRTAPELTANEPAGTQHPWVSGGDGSWRLSAPPGR